ncbi:MerR family transcriptional regulator [Streptacidiphilus sp. PB12-B1b]|uniref:MerR family transcriptional regulator n=1 Tax=Streptacidiphilus sp. PB12-B1b TaxID=2705012 RepID=UPI0015F7FB8C|nr:MerR family transcriptional regulator [Streptacidiphilus sp. PB12-B1b]QMU75631.1 MerR family transcriptional regulator [Streptacidiphilus sp. PB12-B1b]
MSLAVALPQEPAEPDAPDGTPRYTIGEVVARTGLTAHTLRWYERIGLLEHPARSHSGQRRFSDRDLAWLQFLGKLRLTAMPVADMVRYAELRREGEHTAAARRALLEAHREEVRQRIADLQATLLIIDCKIDMYAERQQQL